MGTGGGGIIEFDAATDTLVHQWPDETGALYESPDGGFIVSANKAGNLFHVLQPQAGGEKSTKGFKDIMIPAPGSPIFYPNGQVRDEETGESFEDYLLFTPLINNPSRNFIECQYAEDGMTVTTHTIMWTSMTFRSRSSSPLVASSPRRPTRTLLSAGMEEHIAKLRAAELVLQQARILTLMVNRRSRSLMLRKWLSLVSSRCQACQAASLLFLARRDFCRISPSEARTMTEYAQSSSMDEFSGGAVHKYEVTLARPLRRSMIYAHVPVHTI